MKKNPVLVLTGGGTAGHVWPHFALFDAEDSQIKNLFLDKKLDVHYLGSSIGIEKNLVTQIMPEWNYHSIATGKLRRYLSFRNLTDPLKVITGFLQTLFLFFKIKPSCVFSKGGYVAAPVVWAAWMLRIPVFIHESDATIALATKMTLPFCTKAIFSFPETIQSIPNIWKKKCLEIGLPLRASLFQASKQEAKSFFAFNNHRKVLLVFGGSLGARSLNEKIFAMIQKLCDICNVIHIVGRNNSNPQIEHENYRQYEFLTKEMNLAYAITDFAICRAGASSIFELSAARIPMILVPLGTHASRGDQIINAKIFEKKGWAVWYEESTLTSEKIITAINDCLTHLDEKKAALETAPSRNAAEKISAMLADYLK